jgi:hypothetical protein
MYVCVLLVSSESVETDNEHITDRGGRVWQMHLFQMDLVDLSAHTKKIKIIEMSQIFIIQKLVLQE